MRVGGKREISMLVDVVVRMPENAGPVPTVTNTCYVLFLCFTSSAWKIIDYPLLHNHTDTSRDESVLLSILSF